MGKRETSQDSIWPPMKRYYVYTHGDDDRSHYYDDQGQRHYVDEDPRRYFLDDDHQVYYVDDDGLPRYPWRPPWQENPS